MKGIARANVEIPLKNKRTAFQRPLSTIQINVFERRVLYFILAAMLIERPRSTFAPATESATRRAFISISPE